LFPKTTNGKFSGSCGEAYHQLVEDVKCRKAYLDQELISPSIKRLETLGAIHIINQNTTIGSSVKSDTERLESFLTSGIP
jgi:hypothetical protein